jgi:hypothetical protein
MEDSEIVSEIADIIEITIDHDIEFQAMKVLLKLKELGVINGVDSND